MGTLKDVKRRLFFDDGKITADDGHEELLQSSESYRRLVEAETKMGPTAQVE